MSLEPTSPPSHIGHMGRTRRLLAHAYLGFAIAVVPTAVRPEVWMGDGSALVQTSVFRASLLAVTLALGLAVFLLVSQARLSSLRPRQLSGWQVSVGALIAWILITTASPSLGPWGAALGDPFRMDGALVQAGWFALAILSCAVVRAVRISASAVASWVAVAGTLTSVWTLLQGTGFDPLLLLANVRINVPAGAFGHGSFASMFIVAALLVTASVWSCRNRVGLVRYAVIAILGLGIAAAGGRAAFIGLLIGFVVLLAGHRRTGRTLRRLLSFIVLTVIGMAISVAVVDRSQAQARNLVEAARGSDPSLNSRFVFWSGGLRLLLANPLFGVGAGGFEYGVWPYLNEDEAAVLIREPLGERVAGHPLTFDSYTISGGIIAITDVEGALLVTRLGWDKAHNYLIDLGLTAGIPSVALFVVFVILALVALMRSRAPLAIGAAGGLIAFVVYGQAWFGFISLDPVFWTVIGAALAFTGRDKVDA